MVNLHYHDFAEFFVVESGSGYHHFEDKCNKLCSGDLVLVAPQHAHGFDTDTSFSLCNIAIPLGTWQPLMNAIPELAYWMQAGEPIQVSLKEQQIQRMKYWIETFADMQASLLDVQSMILDVLRCIECFKHAPQELECPQWLSEALDHMKQPPNLSEGIPALVHLCGRSREYIWRVCRKTFDRSPNEILTDMRMAFAARSLRLSQDSILSISLDCGFSNLSHFYRLFSRYYALTPKAYRIQHHARIQPLYASCLLGT